MTTSAALSSAQLSSHPWAKGAATRRAQALLIAGLLGSHLAGIVAVSFFGFWHGKVGAGSAAIAAAVVIAFYGIGQGVQVIMAEASPHLVLFSAITSYLLRVVVLGIVLAWTTQADLQMQHLDRAALLFTVIATVVGWLSAEIWRYQSMPMPIYDTEYHPPKNGGDQ